MKRLILWAAGIAIVGGVTVLALQAQERQTSSPTSQQPQATAQTSTAGETQAKSEGTIAFTFTDDAQMKQFAQVWGQRQGVLTRMTVLQAYWNQEQTGLTQLNQELLSKYNLDVKKNYTLDTDRKALLEQPLTPEQVAAQQAAAAPTPPTSAAPTDQQNLPPQKP